MSRMRTVLFAVLWFMAVPGLGGEKPVRVGGGNSFAVAHGLDVRLDPASHRILVSDRIELATGHDGDGDVYFVLHEGLQPRVNSHGWRLEKGDSMATKDATGIDPSAKRHGRVPIEGWRLIPLGRRVPNVVELEYGGAIQHSVGSGHDSDFSGTAMIGSDSVFLRRSLVLGADLRR